MLKKAFYHLYKILNCHSEGFSPKNPKKAFTLAEVLITLAIIGVVAAMTIPSLKSRLDDQQYRVALKKLFAELDQAAKLIAQDNGGSLKGAFSNNDGLKNIFASKMLVTKSCNAGTANGNCWHPSIEGVIKYLNGTNFINYTSDTSAILLNDGSMFRLSGANPTCSNQYSGIAYPISCALIRVDVNGFKKPNVVGKDIFDFHLLDGRLAPRGGIYDSRRCSDFTSGDYCTPQALLGQDY